MDHPKLLCADIRDALAGVRCEYPRDPCATAKDIQTMCDNRLAVSMALRSLSTLEAIAALLDTPKEG